jgi:hypothetical protein
MTEIPHYDLDPESLEAEKIVQEFIDSYYKADFLTLMYPDKEAINASNMLDQLIDAIIDGQIDLPNIESNVLNYWGNLEGENDDPIMKKGEEQYNQLQKYVSKITGVSIERINAVNIFWAEQFLD